MIKMKAYIDPDEACLVIDGHEFVFSRPAFSQLVERITKYNDGLVHRAYCIFDPDDPPPGDPDDDEPETEEGH